MRAFARALLALGCSVGLSTTGAAPAPCPRGEAAWLAWRDARVRELPERLRGLRDIFARGYDEAKRSYRAYVRVAYATLQRCAGPRPPAGLRRLERFLRAEWLPGEPQHSLGTLRTDTDYYARVPAPEMMELPRLLRDPRFLARLDDENGLEPALAQLAREDASWRYFVYDSQHVTTPDQSAEAYGRLFVLVPGRDYDRFFQIGLRTPGGEPPAGISLVAVQKADPRTHRPLARPRAYYKDFWRVREARRVRVSTRLQEEGGLENCTSCHKSALIPIVPEPESFDRGRYEKVLAEVNARMARYGVIEQAHYPEGAAGPALGPIASPLRSDAFLAACAGERARTPEARARLRRAMACESCHDGAYREVLDFPSALREQTAGGSLVYHFVVSYGRMPAGAALSDGEREALFECLRAEYYDGFGGAPGLLARWLRGQPAVPRTAARAPRRGSGRAGGSAAACPTSCP